MQSNAYFLAKFRFDTAENEPAKNLQNFPNFANSADPNALPGRRPDRPRGTERAGDGRAADGSQAEDRGCGREQPRPWRGGTADCRSGAGHLRFSEG